jgi:integrase
MSIKVHLRQKPLKDKERASLYLDFYPAIYDAQKDRMTRRDFLGRYVYINPKGYAQKDHNRKTKEWAEGIRANRENELNKSEIYSYFEREQKKKQELRSLPFVDYMESKARSKTGKNLHNYKSPIKFWRQYDTENLKFEDIKEDDLRGFKTFLSNLDSPRRLDSGLSLYTQRAYFNKVKSLLSAAFREGIIERDLGKDVKFGKIDSSPRQFLTEDELISLVNTPCSNPLIKRAALFSALTGLRFSDIQGLKWSNLETTPEGPLIRFTIQKTGKDMELPISDQAHSLMKNGNLNNPHKNTQVFKGLKYHNSVSAVLARWVGLAGIKKKITFHCFRHAHAVLQLDKGTSLYTVSKLLGHSDITTTQVYANLLDKSKREAANRIDISIE